MRLSDVLCSYLFNLVGQFIGCQALLDQCCRIISALLKTFKSKPSKEIICVLGEQLQVGSFVSQYIYLWFCIPTSPHHTHKRAPISTLLYPCSALNPLMQFLVSKLVACCIPSEAKGEESGRSSQVLSLLLQLTVDSDPSLYDYIRVSFLTSQQWIVPPLK